MYIFIWELEQQSSFGIELQNITCNTDVKIGKRLFQLNF